MSYKSTKRSNFIFFTEYIQNPCQKVVTVVVGMLILVDFCLLDIFSYFRVRVRKRAFDALFWHNHFIDNGIFLPEKLV